MINIKPEGEEGEGRNFMGVAGQFFGGLNDAAKWIMSVAMIWGRLEVLPVLVILSWSYWRY